MKHFLQSLMGRSVSVLFLTLFAVLPLSRTSAEWARLEDGQIAEVLIRGKDKVRLKLATGDIIERPRSEIKGWLSDQKANTMVDAIVRDILKSRNHERIKDELDSLQSAAVPRLVSHLNGFDAKKRLGALAALQFVWSEKARPALDKALKDRDPEIKALATRVAQLNLDRKEQAKAFETPKRLDPKGDPRIAGPALAAAELNSPSLERMRTELENDERWSYLHALLPRYHHKSLTPITRRMLKEGDDAIKLSALCALIYQNDHSPDTRAQVVRLLDRENAALRDMAAEYLRWHGTKAEIAPLKTQFDRESDLHAKASLLEAARAIKLRETAFAPARPGSGSAQKLPRLDLASNPEEAFATAEAYFLSRPAIDQVSKLIPQLSNNEMEPMFLHAQQSNDGKGGENYELAAARSNAVRMALGYPSLTKVDPGSADAERPQPVSTGWVPPVRDYFDRRRKSYGVYIPEKKRTENAFAGLIHVGDDAAWRQQHGTVVAIADGVVRLVRSGMPSWGGLVIVEHKDEKGATLCSLYGHLGPLITVRPGDHVRKGQKLGSLGRAWTIDAGGYETHIHFGIHRGAFKGGVRVGETVMVAEEGTTKRATVIGIDRRNMSLEMEGSGKTLTVPVPRGTWITGYLSREDFQSGLHGWFDPQKFLQERVK